MIVKLLSTNLVIILFAFIVYVLLGMYQIYSDLIDKIMSALVLYCGLSVIICLLILIWGN